MVGIHHLFEKMPTTPIIVHCLPDSAKVFDPPTPIVEAQKWGLRGWVTCPRPSAQSFSVWIRTQAMPSTSNRGMGYLCVGAAPLPTSSSPCCYAWFLCEKTIACRVLHALQGSSLSMVEQSPFWETSSSPDRGAHATAFSAHSFIFLWLRVVSVGENEGRVSLELEFQNFLELIAECCSVCLCPQHSEVRIPATTCSSEEADSRVPVTWAEEP